MRRRRLLGGLVRALTLGIVFVIACLAGAVLHLDLGAPRAFVKAKVNDLLAATFEGTIRIIEVGGLGIDHVEGVEAVASDPDGHRVAWASGVRGRVGLVELLSSLFRGDAIIIPVERLEVSAGEVVLDRDRAGDLRLSKAFAVRGPPGPEPKRPTLVQLREIAIDHAWAHGDLVPGVVLDADVGRAAGAFEMLADGVAFSVANAEVRTRGNPGLDASGVVAGRAVLPSEQPSGRSLAVRFEGRIGDVVAIARGALDGPSFQIEAGLEASPTAAARIAEQARLRQTVRLHLEAVGALPLISARARASAGDSAIDVSAALVIPLEKGQPVAGPVHVRGNTIDLGAAREGLPPTRLSFELAAALAVRSAEEIRGSFWLRSDPGTVDRSPVPATTASGTFTADSLEASVDVAEPGLPVHAEVSVGPSHGGREGRAIQLSATATAPDLRSIARFGPLASGSADVDVRGVLLLPERTFDATVGARVRSFGLRGAQVGYATLHGEAKGSLDLPHLAVSLEAQELRAFGYTLTALRARAAGTTERVDLEAYGQGGARTPSARLRASLGLEPEPRADDVRLELDRAGVTVTATAASIRNVDNSVIVDRARVDGLGQPLLADVRIGRRELDVHAKTQGIELARVARLASLDEDIRGYLILDADLHATPSRAAGRLEAIAAGLRIPRLGTTNLRVKGIVTDRTIRAEGEAELVGAGRLEVTARPISLDGPLFQASSWKRATGTVDVRGRVRLAEALSRVPEEERVVSAASGRVSVDVRASRAVPDARPSFDLQVLTQGLVLAGPRKAPPGGGPPQPPRWQIRGVDGTVRLDHDPDSGRTNAEVRVRDHLGLLVSADAGGELPLDALLRTPAKALEQIADVPLAAHVIVHRRSIGSLPPVLGRIPFEGVVQLEARHEGTLRKPKIDAKAKVEGLRARGAPKGCAHPLDVSATVDLAGNEARARLGVRTGARAVLDADATIGLDGGAGLLAGAGRWRGSADLTLTRFPLDIVQAALGRPIVGTVTGALAVRDLHEEPRLDGALELRDVVIDEAAFPRARAEVAIERGALTGKVRLDQSGGFAEASVASGVDWATRLLPALRRDQRTELRFRARQLRLGFLNPLLGDAATGLDGRLSGQALIRAPAPGATTIEGALELRDGAVSVAQIGEQLSDIDAKLVMARTGKVTLERLTARAPTGRLSAKATAELDGLSLARAAGELRVAEGESIPVAFEGVPMGQVYGRVIAKAERNREANRLDIELDVPLLDVELPRSSGKSVQKLSPAEHIRTGVFKQSGFVEVALKPSKPRRRHADLVVRTTIDLGQLVKVHRGTTLDVVIRGRVTVETNGDAQVDGTIKLVRGKLELQGKSFTIERGFINFSGPDPENPQIVATAYWDAPDGTRVFAEFSGNVEEGKLDLRSEPALTQDQIVSLIAFGSTEGGVGASSAGAGASVAGGVITEGINDVIAGITPDITTRVDTSESGNPKPEVAIQISSRVSARFGYAVGAPSAGDAPDRATVTLDWRFYKDWSIAAEVGDHGSTAVDVIWRVRY